MAAMPSGFKEIITKESHHPNIKVKLKDTDANEAVAARDTFLAYLTLHGAVNKPSAKPKSRVVCTWCGKSDRRRFDHTSDRPLPPPPKASPRFPMGQNESRPKQTAVAAIEDIKPVLEPPAPLLSRLVTWQAAIEKRLRLASRFPVLRSSHSWQETWDAEIGLDALLHNVNKGLPELSASPAANGFVYLLDRVHVEAPRQAGGRRAELRILCFTELRWLDIVHVRVCEVPALPDPAEPDGEAGRRGPGRGGRQRRAAVHLLHALFLDWHIPPHHPRRPALEYALLLLPVRSSWSSVKQDAARHPGGHAVHGRGDWQQRPTHLTHLRRGGCAARDCGHLL
ncbi:hypothetical protein T492DRAFT_1113634 [Pavlovales sp. CCMP2436]|nr:hypothetical protein T492DRAFT_1113634 [Pavlovales sp. CCMP2436]